MGFHSLSNFPEVSDGIAGSNQSATGVWDTTSGVVLHFSTTSPFIAVQLLLGQHFPRTRIDLGFGSLGRAASSVPEPLMPISPNQGARLQTCSKIPCAPSSRSGSQQEHCRDSNEKLSPGPEGDGGTNRQHLLSGSWTGFSGPAEKTPRSSQNSPVQSSLFAVPGGKATEASELWQATRGWVDGLSLPVPTLHLASLTPPPSPGASQLGTAQVCAPPQWHLMSPLLPLSQSQLSHTALPPFCLYFICSGSSSKQKKKATEGREDNWTAAPSQIYAVIHYCHFSGRHFYRCYWGLVQSWHSVPNVVWNKPLRGISLCCMLLPSTDIVKQKNVPL